MTVTEVTKIRGGRLRCDAQMDGRFSPAALEPPLPHANPMHPQKNQPRRIYLSYPAGQPSSATSGTALFWGSRGGWVHTLYGETSALASAPELHTAVKRHRGASAASVCCTTSCTDFSVLNLRMEEEVGEWRANGWGRIKATTFYTSQLLILRQNDFTFSELCIAIHIHEKDQ